MKQACASAGSGCPAPAIRLPEGQGGFSLVEILVSAVVTAVVTTSAFYFLTSQNRIGTQGNDQMKSVNLGKLKMDSLKVSAYDDLVSGSDTVSERYIRAWSVTVLRDAAGKPLGVKKIDLNVIWPLTADHAVGFSSLKSDDRFKEASR